MKKMLLATGLVLATSHAAQASTMLCVLNAESTADSKEYTKQVATFELNQNSNQMVILDAQNNLKMMGKVEDFKADILKTQDQIYLVVWNGGQRVINFNKVTNVATDPEHVATAFSLDSEDMLALVVKKTLMVCRHQ